MKEIEQHRPRNDGSCTPHRASPSLHHCNANDQQRFSSVPLLAHLFPLLLFFPSLRFTLFSLVVLSRTAAPTTISASPTTLNSTRVSTQLRSEDRRGLLSPRATLTRAGAGWRLDWRALWARARFSSVHRRPSAAFFSAPLGAREQRCFSPLSDRHQPRTERREFPRFLRGGRGCYATSTQKLWYPHNKPPRSEPW